MRFVGLILVVLLLSGCGSKADGLADNTNPSSSTAASATDAAESSLQYPATASWEHANDRQRQRAERSFAQMKKRSVPVFGGPLFVDDDEEVKIQNPQDVARRTLVLWSIARRAGGIPVDEAMQPIEQLGLWDFVSDEEKRYLKQESPDPDESQSLVWRLESIWVLMWALGYVETLDWPSDMCDVPKLAEMVKPHETSGAFITQAKLRSKAELLDAQDLIMRIHWAIRDAQLEGDKLPKDLDWTKPGKKVPMGLCPAVGVVEERHYALNWLVNFLSPKSWDDVDTPT